MSTRQEICQQTDNLVLACGRCAVSPDWFCMNVLKHKGHPASSSPETHRDLKESFLTDNHVVADIAEGGFFEDVLLEDVRLVVFWQLWGSGGGRRLALGVGELPSACAHLRHQVYLQFHIAISPLEEIVCTFTPQAFGLEGEGSFQFLQLQQISQLELLPFPLQQPQEAPGFGVCCCQLNLGATGRP